LLKVLALAGIAEIKELDEAGLVLENEDCDGVKCEDCDGIGYEDCSRVGNEDWDGVGYEGCDGVGYEYWDGIGNEDWDGVGYGGCDGAAGEVDRLLWMLLVVMATIEPGVAAEEGAFEFVSCSQSNVT